MAGGRGIPIRLTLHITGNEEQRPGVSTQHLSTGPGGVRNLKRLVSSHRSHPIVQTDSCWKGQTKIVKSRKREPINIFLSSSSQHKISEKLIHPRHIQMLMMFPRHWVCPACDQLVTTARVCVWLRQCPGRAGPVSAAWQPGPSLLRTPPSEPTTSNKSGLGLVLL